MFELSFTEGLNRENWTWTNGKSLHYQDWYQAQPDGDNLSQPIISLRRSEGSRFGDYAVGQENQGFICEKDNGNQNEKCQTP